MWHRFSVVAGLFIDGVCGYAIGQLCLPAFLTRPSDELVRLSFRQPMGQLRSAAFLEGTSGQLARLSFRQPMGRLSFHLLPKPHYLTEQGIVLS